MVSALRRPNAAIAEWTVLMDLMSSDVVSIDFIAEFIFSISVQVYLNDASVLLIIFHTVNISVYTRTRCAKM